MRQVPAGSTDVSVTIRIVDASDGTPETGVEHNTSGIDLWYRRDGEAKVSITEAALSALTDAHSDGGIEHIGDGYYRLDLPDAAVAAGADFVTIGGTVTGMVVIGTELQLTDDSRMPVIRGTVSDSVSPTSDEFTADGDDLSATADVYIGSVLAFTSGALKGIARRISDYAGAPFNMLTFDVPFPAAPSDGDEFVILGRID